MIGKIPNALAGSYPLPYARRKSHKAWDPNLSGKPRLIKGPYPYWETRAGKNEGALSMIKPGGHQ